jgi:hypothetical protein
VRIPAIESLLQTIRDTPRVWMATCGEIAGWAMQALEGSTPYTA